jgi:hypothetical protein
MVVSIVFANAFSLTWWRFQPFLIQESNEMSKNLHPILHCATQVTAYKSH